MKLEWTKGFAFLRIFGLNYILSFKKQGGAESLFFSPCLTHAQLIKIHILGQLNVRHYLFYKLRVTWLVVRSALVIPQQVVDRCQDWTAKSSGIFFETGKFLGIWLYLSCIIIEREAWLSDFHMPIAARLRALLKKRYPSESVRCQIWMVAGYKCSSMILYLTTK